MAISLNYFFVYFFAYIVFPLSIFGYGYYFKYFLLNEKDFSFGESGIFGFFFLYILSVLIHFFLPINIIIGNIIIFIGLILSFNNLKKIKNNFLTNWKNYTFIICLSLIVGATNNLHDDAYLYQLPYINYLQSYKIMFGLVSLNEFAAYSHGFYDVMALFKVPFYSNQLLFILPVIFTAFFCIFLTENFKDNNNLIKYFFYIIFFIILFRFTRSKQFGTDLPVICLIFLIQIYILNFLEKNKDIFFLKALIIFLFSIFFKIYAVFSIIYFLVFIKYFKQYIILFFKKKKILILLAFVCLISFSKHFIHSGCLIYPISSTCFDKSDISWSFGSRAIELRKISLEAGAKGIRAYIRDKNKLELITSEQYIEKFKYTYHKNVIKDPDFERFLVVLSIFLLLLIFSYTNKFIKKQERYFIFNNLSKLNSLILILPALLWLIYLPQLRYGGYAYLTLAFYVIFSKFKLIDYVNKKNLNTLLIIGILFFTIKNINRINQEITTKKFSIINYPLPVYKKFNYQEKKKTNIKINVTDHWQYCAEIAFPCIVISKYKALNKIEIKNGYYFLTNNDDKTIENIKNEIYRTQYGRNE